MTATLFSPLALGPYELAHRVIMAPLTRMRASQPGNIPSAMNVDYYAQRASRGGLIISEGSQISPSGQGMPATPGIHTPEQIAGWKAVTEAVHAKRGRIFLQLWHVGRISHSSHQPGGAPPIAPSAIAASGNAFTASFERVPFETPQAIDTDLMPLLIEVYGQAAANAKEAGFDGVEIHGANGYLLDQFLQDSTNQRNDQYGGSIENRARLMLEAVDAAISVWGPDRVGLHIAPRGDSHDMGDSDPLATFGYVARAMRERGVAFIFARERVGADSIGPQLKAAFGGVYIANEGLDLDGAQALLGAGEADAVSFGKLFISNPDLPARLQRGAELNPWKLETFYSPGAEGYVDYPALALSEA